MECKCVEFFDKRVSCFARNSHTPQPNCRINWKPSEGVEPNLKGVVREGRDVTRIALSQDGTGVPLDQQSFLPKSEQLAFKGTSVVLPGDVDD
jgi:hypothetical protein